VIVIVSGLVKLSYPWFNLLLFSTVSTNGWTIIPTKLILYGFMTLTILLEPSRLNLRPCVSIGRRRNPILRP